MQVPVMELLGGKTVTGFSLYSITESKNPEEQAAILNTVMELLERKVMQPLTGTLN